MSFFVIGDIHGCYDEFLSMLELIEYEDDDCLILIGDYIDRGKKSREMVQWMMKHTGSKYVYLRGNHEEEFITCVSILQQITNDRPLLTICEALHDNFDYFDTYGTIRNEIREHNMTMDELITWASFFQRMPYRFMKKIGAGNYCIAHAGYMRHTVENKNTDLKEFTLYAREEAYTIGGSPRSTMIHGHTPTIVDGEFTYNNGDVFYYEDKERNMRFFDIDCGCVFRERHNNAKLACIRLDDEKIFYI